MTIKKAPRLKGRGALCSRCHPISLCCNKELSARYSYPKNLYWTGDIFFLVTVKVSGFATSSFEFRFASQGSIHLRLSVGIPPAPTLYN